MRRSVVVTGAGGYIGRHVVRALLDRGCDVAVVDLSLGGVDERARKIEVDLFDGGPELYDELGRPDALVHLAWRNGFNHSALSHMDDLPRHYRLLDSLLAAGLPQLTVMGTMHEVGYWEGAITEHTPCRPMSLYGVAKNALRDAVTVAARQHGAALKWIRAYYIVGDDRQGNSIFSKLLTAADEGKETFPFTSGRNLYDFISLQELSAQIAAIVDQDLVTGIINACSGEPVSLAERVEKFIRENQLNIRLDYGAFPDRPYDSPGVWGDPTRVRQILARDHRTNDNRSGA